MGKWGKLYSNLWIKIADSDFDKLKQIQKDYQLKSVEEVLELLVNPHTINCLAEESREYITKSNSRIRYAGTPVSK